MQVRKIIPNQDREFTIIDVINTLDPDDHMSAREVAQKMGIYPSKDNLKKIEDACMVHSDCMVAVLTPSVTGLSRSIFKIS